MSIKKRRLNGNDFTARLILAKKGMRIIKTKEM